jgi:hypothetical protein
MHVPPHMRVLQYDHEGNAAFFHHTCEKWFNEIPDGSPPLVDIVSGPIPLRCVVGYGGYLCATGCEPYPCLLYCRWMRYTISCPGTKLAPRHHGEPQALLPAGSQVWGLSCTAERTVCCTAAGGCGTTYPGTELAARRLSITTTTPSRWKPCTSRHTPASSATVIAAATVTAAATATAVEVQNQVAAPHVHGDGMPLRPGWTVPGCLMRPCWSQQRS